MTFEEAYENYYDLVYKSIYMRLLNREDTEDVVQETFIKAMKAWDRFDPSKAKVSTWLCTIAKNTMLNSIRGNKKHTNASFDELRESGFDPGQDDKELLSLTDSYAQEAYEILVQLKDSDRELLSLRYAEELSYKEIAANLGSNDKAIAKRVERLLGKCRELHRAIHSESQAN